MIIWPHGGDPEVRAFEPASSSKCCANRECLPLRTAPALHPQSPPPAAGASGFQVSRLCCSTCSGAACISWCLPFLYFLPAFPAASISFQCLT